MCSCEFSGCLCLSEQLSQKILGEVAALTRRVRVGVCVHLELSGSGTLLRRVGVGVYVPLELSGSGIAEEGRVTV